MARRRKKRSLRPRLPARIKKRRRRDRGEHQPELVGLGLLALGLFLGSVLYVGWNGGYVGAAIADGIEAVVGAIVFVLPIALVVLGWLLVARSKLVDVRPFRTGLTILLLGLLLTLGEDEGGALGGALAGLLDLLQGPVENADDFAPPRPIEAERDAAEVVVLDPIETVCQQRRLDVV
jgi:hypothetical protein